MNLTSLITAPARLGLAVGGRVVGVLRDALGRGGDFEPPPAEAKPAPKPRPRATAKPKPKPRAKTTQKRPAPKRSARPRPAAATAPPPSAEPAKPGTPTPAQQRERVVTTRVTEEDPAPAVAEPGPSELAERGEGRQPAPMGSSPEGGSPAAPFPSGGDAAS